MIDTKTFIERAKEFKRLHDADGILVTPNPWDAGSAKILGSLGFKALATTSAGVAFSLGKPDGYGAITLAETIANAKSILNACSLPVSADLENGYGFDPLSCADTILLAAESGLSGGSIEDATGDKENPVYDFKLSVERIEGAVKAKRSLGRDFILTARAENLIYGIDDMKDTIARLEAYAIAGADVVFAPGLQQRKDIIAVVKAVAPVPVSVLMGISGVKYSIAELEDMGVKRVSVGSALFRTAYSAVFEVGKLILQNGQFDFADKAVGYGEFNKLFL